MEMTKDVILARQLRLATISNLVGQGILDEPSAKELLSGALEPGNDSTIVDDSALLGDPEALVKIAAELGEVANGSIGSLINRKVSQMYYVSVKTLMEYMEKLDLDCAARWEHLKDIIDRQDRAAELPFATSPS